MKTKEIELGYVAMYCYTPKTDLNPEWQTPGHDHYIEGDEKKNVDEKEVVLQAGAYTLVIDYPLETPFKKSFVVGVKGMTRRALVNLIVKSYKKVYADEDTAVGDPGHIPGMFNRQRSEGPYGIWGHDLGDLMLSCATVKRNGDIELEVDS